MPTSYLQYFTLHFAGAALAEISDATYNPQPSIDLMSQADAASIVTAMLAEAESVGPADTADITAKTGGLLSEIGALKGMMRGIAQ